MHIIKNVWEQNILFSFLLMKQSLLKHKLSIISTNITFKFQVYIEEKESSWKGAYCESHTDPHMKTFDNK